MFPLAVSFWHWLQALLHFDTGIGYQFWSGMGSDLGELTLVGIALGAFRKINCSTPWCLRIGKHPTADGMHHLCRKHHPDHPGHKMSLAEIVKSHRDAKASDSQQ